ncbi:hypothetical protein DICPUDRAFT_40819 [Dictyostelium purpureum]|uniref:Glutathione S-transferase n=1 Tax=Dictyostelium purpureum TaxID=5786 RepID=F0ZYV9_DICPU|nr:uncharacterized protein DICPUDRAFT_40819 [Dictyostelium purpureum]EGC30872.1 hypothetical protein DICPUDRAFT_40819 [Dictyostelium purpureum]|eukprot:XP_003292609.1 hypothetical protein DICPUDRAFT_40819 [Dictyostelium purpureum]
MNKVILYADLISQPSRAILFFLIKNNINHEVKLVSIAKMQQTTDDYAKINPFKKLPAIEHGGRVFIESHNILRYLSQEFKIDSMYGPTLIDKCNIDTYLDWHHLGLRRYASTLFFQKFVLPNFGKQSNESFIKDSEYNLPKSLKQIEDIFLKNGQNKFLIGNNLTIADFSCYAEIKQLEMIKYDFSKFKILNDWMKRVEELDGCLQSNKILNRIVSKL